MSRTRLWMVLGFVSVLAAGLVAAGCGGDDEGDGDGGAGQIETIESGTLTIGSDIPFPPFEQGRPPDYDGFDIDLINEIANRLDFELKIKDTSFDTIFRDLAQGKFDMVASATTITPEREQTIDFSNPYYLAEQSLLVQEGSDIESTADLGDATVGVQQGTTGQQFAKGEADVKPESEPKDIRAFPEIDDAFNALQAGQVDVVVNDLPSSQDAVKTKKGLTIVEQIDTEELYGLPIPEESGALLDAVNDALTEIKDDGTYDEIYTKWFEKDPPEVILDATHEPS